MLEYVKNALKIKGELTERAIDGNRFIIYLNGEYYGIFDISRNTFVD